MEYKQRLFQVVICDLQLQYPSHNLDQLKNFFGKNLIFVNTVNCNSSKINLQLVLVQLNFDFYYI